MIHGIVSQGASVAVAAPIGFPADLKLLLRMEGIDGGAVFTDDSPSAHTVSRGNSPTTSTAQFVEGMSSMLQAAGDRLIVPDSDDFHFGSGAFTVFAWTRKTNTNFGVVVGQRSGDPQWSLGHAAGAIPEFQMSASPTGINVTGGAPNAGQWTSMAFSRNASGVCRFRQNGHIVNTFTNASAATNLTTPLTVGADFGGSFGFAGNIDLLFIVKGVDLFDHAGPILSPLQLTPTPQFLVAPKITAPDGLDTGDTLSCTSGFAWPNAATYTYQWRLSGSPISGAASSTYTIQAGDDPKLLSCLVSNNGGNYEVFVGHRHWRLRITANNGAPFMSMTECQLHTRANNGNEVANSSGASASASFGGSTPATAFDNVMGNTNLWWATTSSDLPAWIAYDFGAGQVPDIRRVSIAPRGGGDVAQAPRDFEVQWSDDGSTWTTAWTVTGATNWPALALRYFDKPFLPDPPVETLWTNPASTGERIGIFDTTGSTTPLSSGSYYNLFIDDLTNNKPFFTNGAVAGNVIQVRCPRKLVINGVRLLQSDSTTHGVWRMQGSNDGTNWTSLGDTFTLGPSDALFDNNTFYNFYRLLGVSGNRSNSPFLYAIQYKASVFQDLGLGTSYANTGGTGNRTTIITSSENVGGSGSFAGLVNGTLDDAFFFNNATNTSAHWMKWDFGVPKIIDEFRWFHRNFSVLEHGVWLMQGSNNDSTWTDITQLSLGARFTNVGRIFPLNNSASFRYYRLRGVSGSRSNNPYIREIEFKIS